MSGRAKRDALVSFLLLFGVMAGYGLLETARDTLFFSTLPVERLPSAYVVTALVVTATSWASGHADRHFGRHALSLLLLGIAALVIVIAVLSPHGPTGVFAFYVVVGSIGTTILVRTWTVIDGIFSIRDARAAFAPITAGGGLGAIAGGLLAKRLVLDHSPSALILIAGVVLVFTSGAPLLLHPARIPPATASKNKESIGCLLSTDGVRRLLFVGVALTIAATVGDYLFKRAVTDHVPTHSLASFFATYSVVVNAATVMVQALVAPFVMRRLGDRHSVLVLPTLSGISALGYALVPGLAAGVAMKTLDSVLRGSLHRPAAEVLYVPLGAHLRARVKALVDGVGQRGGQAVAAGVLVGVQALHLPVELLALFVAVSAGLGLGAAAGLFGGPARGKAVRGLDLEEDRALAGAFSASRRAPSRPGR